MSLPKTIVALTAGLVAFVGGQHLFNAATEGRRVQYLEIPFESTRVPSGLDGYRIGFITDIHHYPDSKLKAVVERLSRSNLDLLLLGGDYSGYLHECWKSLSIIAKTKTKNGIYGVEGNHDYDNLLKEGMLINGMHFLSNSGVHVKEKLYIAGVADFKNGKCDFDAALSGAGKEDFTLLVCHNPDSTMVQNTSGADLILCGHTHGGEAALYGKWAPVLNLSRHNHGTTNYGQRFMFGWAKSRDNVPVFTSRGLGSHSPIRIYAPSDACIFTLKSK